MEDQITFEEAVENLNFDFTIFYLTIDNTKAIVDTLDELHDEHVNSQLFLGE